jgi:Domain of unknown function (DUF397)
MTDRVIFSNWWKSRSSGGGDNCIEVASASDGTIGVRDSKDPEGPILTFSFSDWDAFTQGARNDNFCGCREGRRSALPTGP